MIIRTIILLALCFATATATIVITSPLQTEFTNNELNYLYLNFGQIPYGKTLAFDLYITDKHLCSNDDLEHFTKPTYVVSQVSTFSSCSLTKRALVAQSNGAKGFIMASASYDYVQGKVYQGDDGNGKRVHITTLMISNADFLRLKNLKNVEIIANYPVPKQPKATLSVFLSASKRSSYVFLREFRQHFHNLQNYTIIDPVYHTVSCKGCISENCMLDYCCYDYQNTNMNMGQTIIREEMHQYELFKQRGVDKWLEYMSLFDSYCMGNWNTAEVCSKRVIGLINTSDVGSMRNPEETLNEWKNKEYRLGFDSFPEVAINGMVYTGNFDTDQIVQALCQSLTNPPQYCLDGTTEVEQKANSHLSIILVVTLISILVMGVLVICVYRRFVKRELTNDMVSKVGQLVANYANKVSKQKIRQKQKFIEANDEQL